MTDPQNPLAAQKQVPVRWDDTDPLPVTMVNQFLLQVDVVNGQIDSFILTMGQVLPPALLGTAEERKAAADQIDTVAVRPLGRYSFTEARLNELVEMLSRVQNSLAQAKNADVTADSQAKA